MSCLLIKHDVFCSPPCTTLVEFQVRINVWSTLTHTDIQVCNVTYTGWGIYIWRFYYPYYCFVSKPNKIKFLYNISTYFKFLKSILILYFLKIATDKWISFEFVHSRQQIIILFITASNVLINGADGCSVWSLSSIHRSMLDVPYQLFPSEIPIGRNLVELNLPNQSVPHLSWWPCLWNWHAHCI